MSLNIYLLETQKCTFFWYFRHSSQWMTRKRLKDCRSGFLGLFAFWNLDFFVGGGFAITSSELAPVSFCISEVRASISFLFFFIVVFCLCFNSFALGTWTMNQDMADSTKGNFLGVKSTNSKLLFSLYNFLVMSN